MNIKSIPSIFIPNSVPNLPFCKPPVVGLLLEMVYFLVEEDYPVPCKPSVSFPPHSTLK